MLSFGWLHFSDLHQGLDDQSWLWPGVREIIYADLEKLHERCGPWDFVIFSGDLTQHGKPEEFEQLNRTLANIWDHLKTLGSEPSLLTVPGNHDIVHPAPRTHEMHMLALRGAEPELWADFWRDPCSPGRMAVDDAFAPYAAWNKTQPFCTLERRFGALPGDFSAVVQKGERRLGIVGLNSAFLHMPGRDDAGKLSVDVRQMHAVCGGDGPAWVRGCDAALLLTHHSPESFSPDAREHFFGEIATPGRFAAHMCGHQHEHRMQSLSISGAASRQHIQGCSLFGLRHFGHDRQDRRHGYSAGRITIDESGQAGLRLWPRIAKVHQAGHRLIVSDTDAFELDDDQGTPALKLKSARRSRSGLDGSSEEALRALIRRTVDELPALPQLRAVAGSRRIFVDRSLGVIDTTKDHSCPIVKDEKRVSTSTLFSHRDAPRRCFILGESGSGKSSLLSSLAENLLASDDACVPLLVRLGSLPWETRTRTLLSALAEYVSARTGVVLSQQALASAFREAKIILLLDGLDEIQDRAALQQIRDAVKDFSRMFRGCSVVVTCRPWVQADLPKDFEGFELFRLVPLGLEGIAEMIGRIFALEGIAGRPSRDAEEIVRFIEAHQDLLDLAGNPLLCSLVALISLHVEPDAYRTRARILERALDLMIRGWPRETGRDRHEFDALSRGILQECARALHGGLVVSEERLLGFCIDRIIGEDPRIVPSKARSVAIRWVEWQRERVGLLRDAGAGRVAFVHKSFEECLVAAAALDQFHGDPSALSGYIDQELRERHHDVVALLLTAQHAPADIADRVAASLLARASEEAQDDGGRVRETQWSALALLLSFAAEGSHFSDATLECIFDALARASLDHCSKIFHEAGGIQQVRDKVTTMLQRGHRHGPWLTRWFERRMLGADLDLQHGALWIRPSDLAAEEELLGRPGADGLLAASLDLGHEHPWKTVAGKQLTWAALDQWAARVPLETIIARSVETVMFGWPSGASAMSVQLLRRAHWFAGETALALDELNHQDPAITLPLDLAWQQDGQVFVCKTRPALLGLQVAEHHLRAERHFELESNGTARFAIGDRVSDQVLPTAGATASQLGKHFLGGHFARDYAMLFGPQASFIISWDLPATNALLRPDRRVSQSLAGFIHMNFFNRGRASYKLCFSFELGELGSLYLERTEPSSHSVVRPSWLPILSAATDEELRLYAHQMLLEQLAEVHTGAVIISGRVAGLSRREKMQYLGRYLGVRCQNLWILHNWDAIVSLAGERIVDPSVRTLLLALALAQYQTTWRWPSSSRWAELLAAGPPEDPLCAVFWHLCRQGVDGDIAQFFSRLTETLPKLASHPFCTGLGRWMCMSGFHLTSLQDSPDHSR